MRRLQSNHWYPVMAAEDQERYTISEFHTQTGFRLPQRRNRLPWNYLTSNVHAVKPSFFLVGDASEPICSCYGLKAN